MSVIDRLGGARNYIDSKHRRRFHRLNGRLPLILVLICERSGKAAVGTTRETAGGNEKC